MKNGERSPATSTWDASGVAGRTVVVTGGSGVLCGCLAQALGRCGARVAVLGHSHMERAEAVVSTIRASGGDALALSADVLDRESLREAHAAVTERFGPVEILINGAGGARKEATTSPDLSFFDLPEEAIQWVFDLNFLGTFLCCQTFAADMVTGGRGSILNIASMGAVRPLTRSVAYSAAKAAVVNFTQWLAVHMSQEYEADIRVNALVPGFFLTEQNRFLLTDEQSGAFTERGRRILDHTPLGRLGTPEDLVAPALFLLSSGASFVHGSCLVVDGGLSAYGGV